MTRLLASAKAQEIRWFVSHKGSKTKGEDRYSLPSPPEITPMEPPFDEVGPHGQH